MTDSHSVPCPTCGFAADLATTRSGDVVESCAQCERNAFRQRIGLPALSLLDLRPLPPPDAIPGYLRGRKRQEGFQQRRMAILNALEETPGLSTADLADATGRIKTNLQDDLVRLMASGAVAREKRQGQGGGFRFFATGRAA